MAEEFVHPDAGGLVAEDRDSGAVLITSADPAYRQYLKLLRGTDDDKKAANARLSAGLLQRHQNLTIEELLTAKNHRVRLEQRFPEVKAWFYTVDCILDGNIVNGCLVFNSCMLVFAKTRREADDITNGGLQLTLEGGFEYYHGSDNEPIFKPELEFGGRRGDAAPVSPDTLRSDVRTRESIINRTLNKAADKKH